MIRVLKLSRKVCKKQTHGIFHSETTITNQNISTYSSYIIVRETTMSVNKSALSFG